MNKEVLTQMKSLAEAVARRLKDHFRIFHVDTSSEECRNNPERTCEKVADIAPVSDSTPVPFKEHDLRRADGVPRKQYDERVGQVFGHGDSLCVMPFVFFVRFLIELFPNHKISAG